MENRGEFTINWMSEQGTLRTNEMDFEIRKHGFTSGHWTLESAKSGVFASAQKCNPFTRTFEIRDPQHSIELRALSPFGRSFVINSQNQELGQIRPNHPFTRKSRIFADPKLIAFPTLAFAFWLVVITWRRHKRKD